MARETEIRSTDTEVHPEAVRREKEELDRLEQRKADLKNATWMLATSTLLGLVSLYPIIRGTRTDNHTMMLIGFVIALVSFKVLPADKLTDIVEAWRGNGK